jgi:hypothetical protein
MTLEVLWTGKALGGQLDIWCKRLAIRCYPIRRAQALRAMPLASKYRRVTYHLNPKFELLGTGPGIPELLCHCEHCGIIPVRRSQVRRWLAQANEIVLPGLNGWIVIRVLTRAAKARTKAAKAAKARRKGTA